MGKPDPNCPWCHGTGCVYLDDIQFDDWCECIKGVRLPPPPSARGRSPTLWIVILDYNDKRYIFLVPDVQDHGEAVRRVRTTLEDDAFRDFPKEVALRAEQVPLTSGVGVLCVNSSAVIVQP